MDEVSVKVLEAELKALAEKVDAGFKDLKDLLKTRVDEVHNRLDKDEVSIKELQDSIVQLKLDLNTFKTKWTLLVAVVGVVIEVGLRFVG